MTKQTKRIEDDDSFAAIVAAMNCRLLTRYRIEAQRRRLALRDPVKPKRRPTAVASVAVLVNFSFYSSVVLAKRAYMHGFAGGGPWR